MTGKMGLDRFGVSLTIFAPMITCIKYGEIGAGEEIRTPDQRLGEADALPLRYTRSQL